jgi:hypothetical protein
VLDLDLVATLAKCSGKDFGESAGAVTGDLRRVRRRVWLIPLGHFNFRDPHHS